MRKPQTIWRQPLACRKGELDTWLAAEQGGEVVGERERERRLVHTRRSRLIREQLLQGGRKEGWCLLMDRVGKYISKGEGKCVTF